MSLLDQVTEQLAHIELKGTKQQNKKKNKKKELIELDDDISEYITGIVQDESIDDDEKREVITEFLAEATVQLLFQPFYKKKGLIIFLQDKSTENLIDTLLSEWKKLQEKQEKEGEEKRTKLLEEARGRKMFLVVFE